MAFSAGARRGRSPGREHASPSLEQALRLLACPFEHVPAAGDRPHRLHQRLQEPRLARQLLFRRFVPAAFGDDQVGGNQAGERDRAGKSCQRKRVAADRKRYDGENRRRGERQDEQPGPSR